jgi:hypothetical protein
MYASVYCLPTHGLSCSISRIEHQHMVSSTCRHVLCRNFTLRQDAVMCIVQAPDHTASQQSVCSSCRLLNLCMCLCAHCLLLLQDPRERQWDILASVMDDSIRSISAGVQLCDASHRKEHNPCFRPACGCPARTRDCMAVTAVDMIPCQPTICKQQDQLHRASLHVCVWCWCA